jgi:hypothetical protein
VRAEDRALQRNLLAARAMLERAQLLQQLDTLSPAGKAQGVRAGLARLAQRSPHGRTWLGVALSAVRLLRSHPILVPMVTVASRLVHGRGWRWLVVAGVVGAVAWSLQRPSRGAGDTAGETTDDTSAAAENGSA